MGKRKKEPETIYEIAKEYREERPEFYCPTCTRVTKYGETPRYYGVVVANMNDGRCDSCNQQLIKIEESDGGDRRKA